MPAPGSVSLRDSDPQDRPYEASYRRSHADRAPTAVLAVGSRVNPGSAPPRPPRAVTAACSLRKTSRQSALPSRARTSSGATANARSRADGTVSVLACGAAASGSRPARPSPRSAGCSRAPRRRILGRPPPHRQRTRPADRAGALGRADPRSGLYQLRGRRPPVREPQDDLDTHHSHSYRKFSVRSRTQLAWNCRTGARSKGESPWRLSRSAPPATAGGRSSSGNCLATSSRAEE